jgi:DNA-binding GntR family transcriptional regulator
MTKEPEYLAIAQTLEDELRQGIYDSEQMLPSNSALAARFGVNPKTASRAVQHLISQKLLIARSGQRPLVATPGERMAQWPMTGRYAKARQHSGLVFSQDMPGLMRKETISVNWIESDPKISRILAIQVGSRVLHRISHTFIDDKIVELTHLYFPPAIILKVPELEYPNNIKVVSLIENAGYVITKTINEVRAEMAPQDVQDLFGISSAEIIFAQTHGTYGADGEALEAVVNLRPARDSVLTFETYEAPEISG